MQILSLTVSLNEVVDSIASRIDIPIDHLTEIDAAATSPERGGHAAGIPGQLLSGHLRDLYRLERAATALHFLLIEESTSPDRTPAWRHRGATDLPIKLHTEEQRNKALVFLERKGTKAKQNIDDYLTGRLKSQFCRPTDALEETKSADEDDWGKGLEFSRAEIISFMARLGIPHNLEEQRAEEPSALDMLDASAGNQLTYLSSVDVAKVFHNSLWSMKEWRNKLKGADKTPWLVQARRSQGQKGGTAATWDPVVIAQALHSGKVKKKVGTSMQTKKISLKMLNLVFERNPELSAFRHGWEKFSTEQENYE